MGTLSYIIVCAVVFFLAYLINTTMISVFYHRGLAHSAVHLNPRTHRFVSRFGIWLTGLDPKGWVTMHRLHHDFSDTEKDPHSPVTYGIFGVLWAQLVNYESILVKLIKKDPETLAITKELDLEVSPIIKKGMWWMPYVLHAAIAVAFALPTGMWALAACYWLGMMTHPLEGGIVNSVGHAFGGRNFDTPDNSRNNHLAAWAILGEGFQNNHHAHPASAKFSFAKGEVDVGFAMTRFLQGLGILEIERSTLIDIVEARKARMQSGGHETPWQKAA
jgi:stearoyl-CoA desaturase (delta-9 desaturase)